MTTHFFQDHYSLSGFVLIRLRLEHAKTIADKLAGINPWLALNYSAARLESYLLSADASLYRYTVMVDGAITGIVAVRYPWLKGPYLELIGLFPHRQKQGFGTAILEWFEQETKPWATNLWVLVSSFNEGAHRFYLRHGFKEIGAIEALVYPQGTEILLRKMIQPPARQ